MDHPPLFSTVADAITWLDAQPKAPKSPALRALWAGVAVSGGSLSADDLVTLAQGTGLLDGRNVKLNAMVSKVPVLVKTGLLRRVRPALYAPTTKGVHGFEVPKRYHYVATREITLSTSEVRLLIPDEFFSVDSSGEAYHYSKEGDGYRFRYGDREAPVSFKEAFDTFHNSSLKTFTPRSTGNHYDV